MGAVAHDREHWRMIGLDPEWSGGPMRLDIDPPEADENRVAYIDIVTSSDARNMDDRRLAVGGNTVRFLGEVEIMVGLGLNRDQAVELRDTLSELIGMWDEAH